MPLQRAKWLDVPEIAMRSDRSNRAPTRSALSKPRAIIRGRNTVARPPPPTSARILNPEESRTITGSTFEHPSRPVSLSPPIRSKKASGVTTETQAELAFEEE